MISRAEEIARNAHAGQVDKSGKDYWTHPQRVAGYTAETSLPEPERTKAVAAAWLHDVLEDTEVTESELRREFPADVVDAVVALKRVSREKPDDYYDRVKANRLALAVKEADIRDNTDPARTSQLPDEVRTRLAAKYAHAREVLGLSS